MILAVDIGNTNVVLGCMDGRTVCGTARLATAPRRTEHEYAAFIRQVFDFSALSYSDFDGAIICSVVPPLTNVLCEAVRMLTGKTPLVVGAGIKTGLNIRIDDPAQLGSDLVATAVGALADYPTPTIVIDMGTATTFAVLDTQKAMVGGCIMPGVRISLEALCGRTAQLPQISLEAPRRVIGKNTTDCMASGSVLGAAAMIDGMCARIEAELNAPCTAIATGGLAREIIPHCSREVLLDENLLLDGLRMLYQRNQEK